MNRSKIILFFGGFLVGMVTGGMAVQKYRKSLAKPGLLTTLEDGIQNLSQSQSDHLVNRPGNIVRIDAGRNGSLILVGARLNR
jgi:hypothetical protein